MDFYTALPKAELHLHLEGSIEQSTLLDLNSDLEPDIVKAVYEYEDFPGFLRSYAWIAKQISAPAHYALITRRLLESLDRQNVPYAEINLSIGVLLWNDQDFTSIFEAIREEAAKSAVRVYWIFDAVRQFGVEAAMRVAQLAVENAHHGVIGFGIGGVEARGPASWFREVFAQTRSS